MRNIDLNLLLLQLSALIRFYLRSTKGLFVISYQLSVISYRITDHEPLRLLVILVPTLLQVITIIPFIGDHLTMINRKDPRNQRA